MLFSELIINLKMKKIKYKCGVKCNSYGSMYKIGAQNNFFIFQNRLNKEKSG
jgi:hypothetical protein